MIRETLTWYEVDEKLPDDDTTVLVQIPSSESDPVWPGWLCDGQWYSSDGFEIEGVQRWAEMPIAEAR